MSALPNNQTGVRSNAPRSINSKLKPKNKMKFLIEHLFLIIALAGLLCAVIFAAAFETGSRHRKRNGFRLRHRKLFAVFMAFGAITILLAVLSPPAAHADPTFISVTNQPAIVATTQSSNILSWVQCNSQSGVAIQWQFNQASASTSNATLVVYSSVDGTNASTVPFASLTAPSTGATDVIVGTNWSEGQLKGLGWLIIGKIQNSTALTTLTNKAITVRRSPY
jgi:hypothetical protein